MTKLKYWIAANIDYSNISTMNTRLLIELKHTGVYYFTLNKGVKHILSGEDSAKNKLSKKQKVFKSLGKYFIDRLAMPTINAKGEKDLWYINNGGDYYNINKVSKYAKKLYKEFTKEEITEYK